MRTRRDLLRLAASAGANLGRTYYDHGQIVGEYLVPDVDEGRPAATAIMLEGLADTDTVDPRPFRRLSPPQLHHYVQTHVRFRDEVVETFASPQVTLRSGAGDCDDSERVLVTLSRALGYPARFVYFLTDGQPVHVTAQVFHCGAWRWAETTLPAWFGEHPFAALRRLHMPDPGIDPTAYVLSHGRLVPLHKRHFMGSLVGRVGTPISAQDLADALAVAWPSVVGGDPPDGAILVLMAQSAFETGGWSACWNYNLGNFKHTPNDGHDYFQMTASEGEGAATTMVPSQWVSYDTLQDGVNAYLSAIYHRWSAGWQSVLDNDPSGFVAALKAHGYFTGNLAQYQAGVLAWYKKLGGIVPQGPATPVAIACIAGAALLGLCLSDPSVWPAIMRALPSLPDISL